MPNHVSHRIIFSSELTNKQQQLLEKIVENQHGLCGYYLPMPEQLRNTQSPAKIVDENKYFNFINNPNDSEDLSKAITAKMQAQFIKDYGTDNWYDWAFVS